MSRVNDQGEEWMREEIILNIEQYLQITNHLLILYFYNLYL